MGKRRNHQADVVDDANGSKNVLLSESSEEASIGESKCEHVAKAIDSSHVCKVLKSKGFATACVACNLSNASVKQVYDEEGFANVSPSLWVCLKCGNQACGRTRGNHAEQHFNTPHSDSHCLAIETHQWSIHCYRCNKKVSPNSKKQLLQMMEFIKKLAVTLPKSIEIIAHDTSMINHKQTDKELSLSNLTQVRGLSNFGNTCFFNSVLQCLAQTPYLVQVLKDLQEPGEKFILPGGPFKVYGENNDESDEQILPSIEGRLKEWGTFTSILCKTLIEMQNSSDNDTNRALKLLNAFKDKSSQCMDGGQHDSHELLRHLLETVRNEDLRRYHAVILEEIGLAGKGKRKNIDSIQKAHVKFYGNQANIRLLGPDPVFRGVLNSTLECLQCHHSSQKTEPFLDLSLPVMIDKPQPPTSKRKNCGIEDNDLNIMNINVPSNPPPSKHQLKKEKKSARKNKKNRRHRNSVSNSNNNDETSLSNDGILAGIEENNGDEINSELDDESDADIEDNTESEVAPMPKVNESGYSSEKTAHPSPTELAIVSPLNSPLIKNTFSEAETDECRSSPETEHPPIHQLSNVNNIDEVTTGLLKVSMSNNRPLSSSPTRYPTIEGDFSIQSCLNQFTALELMTGSNKVGCEACTARENKKNMDNNTSSKMICTQSTKQYLISHVPPVLILHLKRFQSQRFSGFRKVTKHVTFSMILDLAPVCKNHERPKLYSLFGLVVHQGTLHGGHYVAYVKARRPLGPKDPRWAFLPKKGANESEESKLSDYSHTELDVDPSLKTTTEPPAGEWHCVSDSRVTVVDEATVLKQEAYLLFYERIL